MGLRSHKLPQTVRVEEDLVARKGPVQLDHRSIHKRGYGDFFVWAVFLVNLLTQISRCFASEELGMAASTDSGVMDHFEMCRVEVIRAQISTAASGWSFLFRTIFFKMIVIDDTRVVRGCHDG